MLKGFYEYLKFGYDELSVKGLSITAQAALWDAQSEFGWRTAYCERDRLEMRLAHWESDLANARPDDLEELGVLTMAAYRGLESTAEWLGKSHVARYALE
ncbi:GsfR2 [Macrophomina phaseolina MS6]|uniref:GsfR2 n=1 Tax=Macrophomina phaseolina (strain MS6) TaxID=1126212 RepID=K2R6X1_MACPH|nr:GsfR2 [Macrophomina phaseolina MS6]